MSDYYGGKKEVKSESEDYYGGRGGSYQKDYYGGSGSQKSENCYGSGGGSQSSRPYIVHEGRNPGVYDKWEDCNRQVSGYSGADFHKAPASGYNGGRSQAPKDPSAPYIVFEGHKPGIYNKWDDAKDQVSGYSGATYRKGSSSDEAKRDFIEYSKKDNDKKPFESCSSLNLIKESETGNSQGYAFCVRHDPFEGRDTDEAFLNLFGLFQI